MKSQEYAKRNVEINGLNNHIRFLRNDEQTQGLLPIGELKLFDHIDFVMMNPPFYATEAEMLESAKKKQRPPNSACTGAPIEMITKGGEVEFISQLILESMLPDQKVRIQWFTTMLGKLSSVSTIVERLRQKCCSNYAVTEFVQGQKTKRWAVAWSWQNLRPKMEVARGISFFEKRLLPFPSEFCFEISGMEIQTIGWKIDQQIKSLDLQWQWKPAMAMGLGMVKGDVWSRKARRRKKQQGEDQMLDDGGDGGESNDEEEVALVFKIALRHGEHDGSDLLISIRWMQGHDSVLFESFCGWLRRKIEVG
jgi:23S rRNA (adenine1618-N6)-methyltransferase